MTHITRVLLMTALLISSGRALPQQLPDLTGATIVERGFCKVEEDTVECMEVEKETKRFVIFHEGYVIYFIFKVKDGATKPYMPHEMEQLFPPQKPKGTEV